jgi:hypothetical protein
MALRFCDSFDHYVTADLASKWTGGSVTISAGNGRVGACLRRTGGQAETITIDAQATWFVGQAFKFSALPGSGTRSVIVDFADTGTSHVTFCLNSAGNIEARRGGVNGTLLGTGTFGLGTGVWYYIEAKVTINDSTGVAVLKINGVTDLNLSGQDTRFGTNATANQITIGGQFGAPPGNYDSDDLYICDATGSVNNDFLGDVRVEALLPSGNGNSSQLVGSDADSTDNYLLVDEAAPNGDTDYVESSTPGDKDTYAYGNLAVTAGTVYGIHLLPYAKKTDAGSRSIVSVSRLSATEEDGPVKSLSGSYQFLPDIRETKPGGGAWSVSDVNSAEFGVKVNA